MVNEKPFLLLRGSEATEAVSKIGDCFAFLNERQSNDN